MNKFKIGDKVVYIDRPDWIFEISEVQTTGRDYYRFCGVEYADSSEPCGGEIDFVEGCYRLATQEEINTMWKKQEQDEHDSKTQNQYEIVCPYCFNGYRGQRDYNELNFKDICLECNSEFKVEMLIEVTYSTSKYESQSNKNSV